MLLWIDGTILNSSTVGDVTKRNNRPHVSAHPGVDGSTHLAAADDDYTKRSIRQLNGLQSTERRDWHFGLEHLTCHQT